MHDRVHNSKIISKSGNTITLRALPVFSREIGISGECDAVEFIPVKNGISIKDMPGLRLPIPVEYKHGSGKTLIADRMQLCAQLLCLEEMFCTHIEYGYVWYGNIKKREKIIFCDDDRKDVLNAFEEMHRMVAKHHTPKVKKKKECKSCSLLENCGINYIHKNPTDYIKKTLESEDEED